MLRFKWPLIIILGIFTLILILLGVILNGTTIYRTSFGFFPDSLRVPVGSTVTFMNISSGPMWPASDIHPSHTINSDFDPRDIFSFGEKWSYQFNRKGAWTYHDHVASQFVGKVIAYDENGDTSFDCVTTDKKACWTAEMENALLNNGVKGAFDVLLRIHNENPEFASKCHNFGHDIGLKTYIYLGSDAEFGGETSYCNAGFYHGFIEGLIDDAKDIKKVENFCEEIGVKLKDSFPLAEQQCRHGIGHGILEYYINHNPELVGTPNELVQRALEVCRELNNEGDESMRCASGVFNVYRDFASMRNNFDIYREGKDLFAICSQLEMSYEKEGCYHEFSKLFAAGENANRILVSLESGEKFELIFPFYEYVVEADQEEFLPIITMSWAMILGKRAVSDFDTETVVSVCNEVPSELREKCLRGISEGGFTSSNPHEEYLTVLPICESQQLNDSEKQTCYSDFQLYLRDNYGRTERTTQCSVIPEQFLQKGICT